MSISVRREKVVKALDGISLEIKSGEAVGIIGPNGAGKTTLMGCLLGFLNPDSGKILIDGKAPDSLSVRSKIGYVPERLSFQRNIQIQELLAMHYELARQPALNCRSKIEELLNVVGLEQKHWNLPIEKCSRGMLQRVALAQALVGTPKYLFLDEPTSGVDPGGVIEITKLLTKIRSFGITLVLNSHQLDQVERICDRVVFVRHGKVQTNEGLQQEGKKHALYLRFADVAANGGDLVQRLRTLSGEFGLELVEAGSTHAQFMVANDDDNLRLIRTLIDGGFPLVEVAPRHSKLERMFINNNDPDRESSL